MYIYLYIQIHMYIYIKYVNSYAGTLQIATKIEVRGSQGRITLYYRNYSAGALSDFEIRVTDAAGLLRSQLSPVPQSLAAGGQDEQQLLVECMQPVCPGPQLTVSYLESRGKRDASVDLPVTVTTFQEALSLSGGT
jgi:hypothetical protein